MPEVSSFHDVQFPVDISYGSKGGPNFNTTVLTLASGFEKRNVNWSKLRCEYDVSYGIKELDQMQAALDFFIARMGKAYSFRFKDFLDFTIVSQPLFTGDGTKKSCYLYKSYASGPVSYTRQISKPVIGSMLLSVDGAPWGYDPTLSLLNTFTYDNTGLITLCAPPRGPVTTIGTDGQPVTAPGAQVTIDYCEFDVHVRFDTDKMDSQHDQWNMASWSSIPLVEIKEAYGN